MGDIADILPHGFEFASSEPASMPLVSNVTTGPASIFPSDSGQFWIIFLTEQKRQDGSYRYERQLLEYFESGSLSPLQQLYEGVNYTGSKSS